MYDDIFKDMFEVEIDNEKEDEDEKEQSEEEIVMDELKFYFGELTELLQIKALQDNQSEEVKDLSFEWKITGV